LLQARQGISERGRAVQRQRLIERLAGDWCCDDERLAVGDASVEKGNNARMCGNLPYQLAQRLSHVVRTRWRDGDGQNSRGTAIRRVFRGQLEG
jgi:hypothetical protein